VVGYFFGVVSLVLSLLVLLVFNTFRLIFIPLSQYYCSIGIARLDTLILYKLFISFDFDQFCAYKVSFNWLSTE